MCIHLVYQYYAVLEWVQVWIKFHDLSHIRGAIIKTNNSDYSKDMNRKDKENGSGLL